MNHIFEKGNRFESIKMEQTSLRKDIMTRSDQYSRKYLQLVAKF